MFNKLPNTSQVSVIVKLWTAWEDRFRTTNSQVLRKPVLQVYNVSKNKREEIPKIPADSRLRQLNVYKTKQTNKRTVCKPTINFAKQKIDHADSAASESAKKWQLIGRWLKCGDTCQHTLCMFGWCHNIKISVRSLKIKSSIQTQCTGIILLFTGSQRQIESGQMAKWWFLLRGSHCPPTQQLLCWGPGSLQLPEPQRGLRVNRHQRGTVTFVCWLS